MKPQLQLLQGGKPEGRRPLLTGARVFGIIAIGLFILAVFSGCEQLKKEDKVCCLNRHEECLDPTFSGGNFCMGVTYTVCVLRGTIDDAGVCR